MRTTHFRLIVKYLSTKSVIPTTHIKSKKSTAARLGFTKTRLGGRKQTAWLFRGVDVGAVVLPCVSLGACTKRY